MRARKSLVVGLLLTVVMLLGNNCPGLNFGAVLELRAAGVNKYMGGLRAGLIGRRRRWLDRTHL